MEEKERSPMFELKNIGKQPVKIRLDSSRPIATGEGQYGIWNLWAGFIENNTVTEGKGIRAKKIDKYTGKIVFFPTERLSKELEELCNGNTEVEIEISKEAFLKDDGTAASRYNVKKLTDGVPSTPSSSSSEKSLKELSPTETKFVLECKDFMNDFDQKLTEEDIVRVSKDPQYKDKISEDRALELFRKYC